MQHEVGTLDKQAWLAVKIGLSDGTREKLANEAQYQANMLVAAHEFLKALTPIEQQVRALHAQGGRERAA